MSRLRYADGSAVLESPLVGCISSYVTPLHEDAPTLAVLDLFLRDRQLSSMPVVDRELRPVAIVERLVFVEFLTRPYAKELHGRKPIGLLPDAVVNHHPVAVDISTRLDEVAQRIVDGGPDHMLAGYIVTREGRYAGVGNGHPLLEELTQRRQAELYSLAHYDPLTSLPNRRLFLDRLGQACK